MLSVQQNGDTVVPEFTDAIGNVALPTIFSCAFFTFVFYI